MKLSKVIFFVTFIPSIYFVGRFVTQGFQPSHLIIPTIFLASGLFWFFSSRPKKRQEKKQYTNEDALDAFKQSREGDNTLYNEIRNDWQ